MKHQTLTTLAVFATVILLSFTLGYLVASKLAASKLAADRAKEFVTAQSRPTYDDLIYIVTGEKP